MWATDSLIVLRTIINDLDVPYTYSDSRLSSSLLVGARFVNSDLFSDSYSIILNSGITPDPTVVNDTAFLNLSCIKTAYFIALGESKIAASQGIAIRDGSSSLDLKGVSQFKKSMADLYAKMYDDARIDYQVGGGPDGPVGAAVMSPITTFLKPYGYDYVRRWDNRW